MQHVNGRDSSLMTFSARGSALELLQGKHYSYSLFSLSKYSCCYGGTVPTSLCQGLFLLMECFVALLANAGCSKMPPGPMMPIGFKMAPGIVEPGVHLQAEF